MQVTSYETNTKITHSSNFIKKYSHLGQLYKNLRTKEIQKFIIQITSFYITQCKNSHSLLK